MRYFIYIGQDRLEYVKTAGRRNHRRAAAQGAVCLDPSSGDDKERVWAKLKDELGTYGPGVKPAVLVLGDQELETARLVLPGASRRTLRQMALREMEYRQGGKPGLEAEVTEISERGGASREGVEVQIWAAREERLADWMKGLREAGLSCVCAVPGAECLGALAAKKDEEDQELIFAGLFPKEIRLYQIDQGHCTAIRRAPFCAEVLYKEQMGELVCQELAEQITGFMEGTKGEVRLLRSGFQNVDQMSGRLEELLGIPCREARIPLEGWDEDGSLFPGAAVLAWDRKKPGRRMNLLRGKMAKERREKLGKCAFLCLMAGMLAVSGLGRVFLSRQEEMLRAQAKELSQSLDSRGEMEEWQARLDEEIFQDRGPEEQDFQGLMESMLPGMEWQSFSYDSERHRLTARFRLAGRSQAPEYMEQLRNWYEEGKAGYGGWELEERGKETRCILTVWVETGETGHEDID